MATSCLWVFGVIPDATPLTSEKQYGLLLASGFAFLMDGIPPYDKGPSEVASGGVPTTAAVPSRR